VPRGIVTHTNCDPEQLTFDKAGAAPQRFAPLNGDRFVVRSGAGGAIAVDVERK
jgi:hypothetical protein